MAEFCKTGLDIWGYCRKEISVQVCAKKTL